MNELGPSNGSLTVRTGRTGIGSRAGHDLVIEAERWRATVSPAQVRVTVDARSLRVREGHGGIRPLTDADREEIRRNLEQQVLRSDLHPEITFISTSLQRVNGRRWEAVGALTVAGRTATIRIPIEVEPCDGGTRISATVTIAQSAFGIKPFSTLMGTLRVADEVEVRAHARVADWQG